jgi:serine/threonine-protein kinase
MEPVDVVTTRCREIGLDDTSRANPDATIRVSAGRVWKTVPTLASAVPPSTTSRELPRISVELRGTLSGPSAEQAAAVSDGRDLEVIRTLGEGGMGRVFLARQHSLDRDVAVKTVRDGASERDHAALLAEGAITGHLEHPAVIPVHALGIDPDGRPVLVMKRVEGAAWGELLANPHHEAWRDDGGDAGDRLVRHLEILMQVCNATSFAHSRGIVHRDIKPENVLIGPYGEVYLADWGIALRTADALPVTPMCGTPSYMAPEMVVGGVIDARTDVYLLGATLHHILMGRPRHAGSNFRAVLFAATVSEPIEYPPSVPALLAALANEATSLDPAKRPASAAEVRQAIAGYLRNRSSIALAASAVARLERLEVLVEDGTLTSEVRQRDVDVMAAEVRFALDQALADWGGNDVAKSASAKLEKLLAVRRARAAELERLARDLDPNTARRPRELAYAALGAVGMGLSVSAFVDRKDVSTTSILYESFAPVAIVAVATLVLRKQLLRTALNRRTVFMLQAGLLAVTLHRALGVLAGMSPAHVLLGDQILLAMLALASSAILFRWVAWLGVIMVAGAAWSAAVPEDAMRAFAAATGAAFLVSGFFVWRTAPGR